MEFLAWLTIIKCYFTVILADTLWKMVSVSKYQIDVSNYTFRATAIVQYSVIPKLRCGTSCDFLDWCSTWCLDRDTGKCVWSNALISPDYVATSSSDTYNCYTYRKSDFISQPGVTATSGPVWMSTPSAVSTNLLKGINNRVFHLSCCGVGFFTGDSWILIDLGTPQTIREIRLTTQTYYSTANAASGADIKVGLNAPLSADSSSTSGGNFSNFVLFGSLPNPAKELTTYTFQQQKGISARYISIQKYSQVGPMMAVCQIEAY